MKHFTAVGGKGPGQTKNAGKGGLNGPGKIKGHGKMGIQHFGEQVSTAVPDFNPAGYRSDFFIQDERGDDFPDSVGIQTGIRINRDHIGSRGFLVSLV